MGRVVELCTFIIVARHPPFANVLFTDPSLSTVGSFLVPSMKRVVVVLRLDEMASPFMHGELEGTLMTLKQLHLRQNALVSRQEERPQPESRPSYVQ